MAVFLWQLFSHTLTTIEKLKQATGASANGSGATAVIYLMMGLMTGIHLDIYGGWSLHLKMTLSFFFLT